MAGVDILLAEDDPADRELALRVLSGERSVGRIECVSDGQEAIDLLFGEGACAGRPPLRPRLALLDIKMPRVDGLEVLRRIRADERTRGIPVVMLSSSHEERDIARSQELGANSYVAKPVDFAVFTATLRTVAHYWLDIHRQTSR